MSRILSLAPMLAVMGAIFFLSHQPGSAFGPQLFPGDDKLAHLTVYGLLAGTMLFAFRAFQTNLRRDIVVTLVVIGCLLYGMSDEYHQTFVPGRDASLADLAADLAGALIVCVIWFRWRRTAEERASHE